MNLGSEHTASNQIETVLIHLKSLEWNFNVTSASSKLISLFLRVFRGVVRSHLALRTMASVIGEIKAVLIEFL